MLFPTATAILSSLATRPKILGANFLLIPVPVARFIEVIGFVISNSLHPLIPIAKMIVIASQLRRRGAPATVSLDWNSIAVNRFFSFIRITAFFAVVFGVFSADKAAYAQGRLGLIRDTEIENTIRVYIAPLFKAAGLDPSSVSVQIINDRNLNAFVAGGKKIFIHSGLLMEAKTSGEVIGVLAHEIGHITGGHLSRLHRGLKDASSQSILANVLGGAAAIATGSSDALIAGNLIGSAVSQRSFLAYTRTMERSADQSGLLLLESTRQSAEGLLNFLELLSQQERIFSAGDNPYVRSHPLTAARIKHVREHVAKSKYSNLGPNIQLERMHDRMRGKLKGFVNPSEITLQEYGPNNQNLGAQYARAIALAKDQEVNAAVLIVDGLIATAPQDPFLYELKGDLLKKGGYTHDAVEPYKKALELLPWAALIRINLAQLQLENGSEEQLVKSRENLIDALRYEPEMASAWRFLATAEGRLGNTGNASLALAEEAMLRQNKALALSHSKRAMERLPEASPGWFRAQDIENSFK